MIKILKAQQDACHECDAHKHGVRFELFGDASNLTFLCWACFVPAMEVLVDLGVLRGQARLPLPPTREERGPTGQLRGRSFGEQYTEWASRLSRPGRHPQGL